jgi:excisionase family DNA binding protein
MPDIHPRLGTEPDIPRLFSKEEAAELLSTTPRHIERLMEDGRLGHVRVGRFIRFTDQDIARYLASGHVEPRQVSE